MTTEQVTAERLEELLADERIPLPHRALWAALWDGGPNGELRLDALLALDVRDVQASRGVWLDARTPGKSGVNRDVDVDVSEWTHHLLSLAAGGRLEGPLFVGADGGRMTRREAVEQAGALGIHAFRAGGLAARAAASAD